jgi:hypothetical protein
VSADPAAQSSEPDGALGDAPGAPSAEDSAGRQRAAYEAELSRISSADMMLQAAVSLLNIGAHRLGPIGSSSGAAGAGPASGPGGSRGAGAAIPGADTQGAQRDLEQVRDAIDGVRALLGILERRVPEELRPLRDALAQLQLAYAREAQAGVGDRQPGGRGGQKGASDSPPAGTSANTADGAGEKAEVAGSASTEREPGEDAQRSGPGPAEASGRLWVPGR